MAYDDKKEQPKGVDEGRLESIISQQIELARSHDARERETDRSKALDYYLGKMDAYVPSETGKSRVVSRDVADTMGWMMPGIMRVFTASDKMAIAEPVDQEDTEFARQATDGLNYVFWKDNRGYETVYAATWDALLVGNGVVKTYYDDTPVYSTSFHSGLSEDQVAMLLMPNDEGDAPEVLASEETVELAIDEATGAEIQVARYDLKIRRKKTEGQFVIEAIPPERFLIDQNAIFTDEAAFTAHWEPKTRSELVAMGYDRAIVSEIPEAGENQTPEEASRNQHTSYDSPDASTEVVDYFECFIRIDADDDGEAELVRACFGGRQNGKLLDWEVWEDEHPIDDIPCEPIPHRWIARSITDETSDVQDIKTVLLRQALNNVYWQNNPQRFVKGSIKNPEELQNPSFGGTVYGDQNSEVTPLVAPFVADSAFAAIQYQDEVVQRRTGVGRGTMALDPQALQNQTAEAVREGKDAGYSQIELVARNMAEWGWSKVFRKLLRLMIKHQDKPRDLMINGKPVRIDPRFWNADMDVTINVGLGTGSRDRDLMMLNQILQTQLGLADRFQATGAFDDAIDMLPKILHTMVRMAESAGIRNPEEYYPEYTAEKVQQLKQMAAQRAQQPDPEMQMKMAEMELKAKQEEAKAQANVIKERAQMEADLTTEDQRQQFEYEKFVAEMAFKRDQMEQQYAIEMAKLRQMSRGTNAEFATVKDQATGEDREISLMDMMMSMMERMNTPKRTEIIRDEQGRAIGAVQVPMTEQ